MRLWEIGWTLARGMTLLVLVSSHLMGAVDPGVAAILAKADGAADPAQAVAILQRWQGPPQVIIDVRLGEAFLQEHQSLKAQAAFSSALGLDPGSQGAGIGLVQCAVMVRDWKLARDLCGRWIRPDTARDDDLRLYAEVARQADDPRLAGLLVHQGLVSHPDEEAWRRLDLSLLMDQERFGEARLAVLAMLDRHASDAGLWIDLAVITERLQDGRASRAALEAAMLLDPADRSRAVEMAEAELAADQPASALGIYRSLLATSAADAGANLLPGAVRAALSAGEETLAATWLARIPADRRDRDLDLIAARIAIDTGDLPQADHILEHLVQTGHGDAGILLWAGLVAERRQQDDRAEADFRQAEVASGSDDATASIAVVHLALLLHRHHQDEQARTEIGRWLERDPGDEQAMGILDLVTPPPPPPPPGH